MKYLLLIVALVILRSAPALAQDAAKVDPKHYKVEFENERMRVLRVNYGPREKSVMHSHPAGVAIFLTDGNVRFTLPDGKTQDSPVKAGQVIPTEAQTHLPENLGTKPFELILVELKGTPTADK